MPGFEHSELVQTIYLGMGSMKDIEVFKKIKYGSDYER
jgi:hypothetical protein